MVTRFLIRDFFLQVSSFLCNFVLFFISLLDFRPMDLMKEIFKSTPNLKEAGGGGGGGGNYRRGGGNLATTTSSLQQQQQQQYHHAYHASAPPGGPYHARSTSYGMSPHHCRKQPPNATSPGLRTSPGLPGEPRLRSSTESESRLKSQTNLARSRSAQSLKVRTVMRQSTVYLFLSNF